MSNIEANSTQRRDTTAAIVDSLIKLIAGGGILSTALLAPNAVQALDKPLRRLFAKLDSRERDRELRRIIRYMKSRDLIRYRPDDYQHGIVLTAKGRQRLEKADYAALAIPRPRHWDHRWRIVFFDIPEIQRAKRNALDLKLRELGFKQLQMSIWIHPFPARPEVEAVGEALQLRRYLTYVEVAEIDNSPELTKRFSNLLK